MGRYIQRDMSYPPLIADALSDLAVILRTDGVKPALAFLNQRVAHRFTAIYLLEAMTVRNVHLYDRQGQLLPEALGIVPLQDSFCQHVLREGQFGTSNSASDHRLDGSPFQGAVMAYHGVPMVDASGQLFGSLCHFDYESQPLSDSEFAFLQQAAPVLSGFVKMA